MQKQDLQGAFSTIRIACQMRPADPVVMRATASLLEKADDPLAIYFRKELTGLPDATLEDRRLYAADSIGKGLVDADVEKEVRFLLDKEPANADNWLVAARLYEVCGVNDQALAFARHAYELDSHSEPAAYFLGAQLIKSPSTSAEGLQMLRNIFLAGGADSLPAAVILARQPSLSPADAAPLISRLKTDPQSKEIHKLLALELELKIHPEKRGPLLDEAIQALPAQDENAMREMGLWLNSEGEHDRTLALIPEALRLKSRPLLLVSLDALAAGKRWREIDTLVSTQGVPLDPAIIELFRGRCAMESGRQDDAILHWRAAQSATTGNPDQAFYVANYFRQLGRIQQARDMYRQLAANPSTSRAAYIELLHIESEHGDTASVYGVLREMHQRWAADEEVQNDYAYFSLLLGLNIDESLAIARDLVKASPDKIAHRTLLALALLRTHDPSAALEAYSGLEINWNSQPASSRIVYAAVLQNNGRAGDAAPILSTLRREDFRPEEKALVQ